MRALPSNSCQRDIVPLESHFMFEWEGVRNGVMYVEIVP